jgi:hypothetical protein
LPEINTYFIATLLLRVIKKGEGGEEREVQYKTKVENICPFSRCL